MNEDEIIKKILAGLTSLRALLGDIWKDLKHTTNRAKYHGGIERNRSSQSHSGTLKQNKNEIPVKQMRL